jgi:hypothetical protein
VTSSIQEFRPAYVPSGFRLAGQVIGRASFGFGSTEQQTALFYRRGSDYQDALLPLTVHVAPVATDAVLGSTELRPGTIVELDLRGVTALYHDGIWAPGPGDDEQGLGGVVIHWDRSTVHSITVRTSQYMVGIRGPKYRGVDYSELARIARSLPAD